ncbi:MAG: DUF6787 family protein [Thermonemataceae bacterium]|nr:DUF6787 family protein [Thermonemataceae bacterium]
MLDKLQKRWGVNSFRQVLLILLVFACTGFSVLFIKKPLYAILGFDTQTPVWQKVLAWLVLILPIYNVLLLFYGFIFGQHRFFLLFVKKLFGRLFFFWRKK